MISIVNNVSDDQWERLTGEVIFFNFHKQNSVQRYDVCSPLFVSTLISLATIKNRDLNQRSRFIFHVKGFLWLKFIFLKKVATRCVSFLF